MIKFIHILLISFATLVLVANNFVIQYLEKSSVAAYQDQEDEEEGKSEKNEAEQKVKDFFNVSNQVSFQYKVFSKRNSFYLFNINILPFVLIDIEILPPNFV